MAIYREVQEHGELRVGQRVLLMSADDDGFGSPKEKVIARLTLVDENIVVYFTDGSQASGKDEVWPDEEGQ